MGYSEYHFDVTIKGIFVLPGFIIIPYSIKYRLSRYLQILAHFIDQEAYYE